MELLRGWIGPRVHQALTEVLDWKTQGSPVTKEGQEVKFEDDGSSLRVRSSKKEFVQISKIEGFSRPVQLWLADTDTLLKVIIAAAAAERFEREHKRRVTEGTLGAVIQILDYEIVAHHHGPKRTKITMLINDFKHVGCDGSAPFSTPCSIESQPPIVELLEKLQTLRAQEQPLSQSLASFKAAKDRIGSPSQATSMSSADDGHDRSQAIFATQLPRLQSKKRLREGSLKSNEYQASADDESDSARSSDVVKGGDESDRALAAKSPSRHGAQELPLSHDRQASSDLMDIRENPNGDSTSERCVPKQEEAEKVSRNEAEDTLVKRTNNLLNLLERNKAKPAPPDPRLPQASEPKRDPAGPVTMTSVSAASKDPTPEPQTARAVSTPPSHRSRVTKSAHRSSSPPGPNKPARQSRKASKRVTARDIRISQKQRDLLSRADSWYPPEPGHRTPSANVPISVLQELNSQAERQASALHESLQVSSQSESSEAEENNNQTSESDEPIPTEEWPASPPARVVLPPDSSLISPRSSKSNLDEQGPEPAHDHDLNVTTRNEDNFSSLKPRPSTSSSSSQSDMGSRSYLPRAAKTNSACPSHYSSKVSTPLSRRSPAPPPKATKINPSPTKNLPRLAQQKTGNGHSHDVNDQSRLHFQDYTINSLKANDTSDADHISGENDSKYSRPRILDTISPLSSVPPSREASFQPRTIPSSANSRRNSSPSDIALQRSNRIQKYPLSRQNSKEKPSEILNSSSKLDGNLQSKSSDIELSESESTIETSMPHGLDEANDISSTIPFTQVYRTPYLSNDSLRSPLSLSSPTGANKDVSHRSRGCTIDVRKSHSPKLATDEDRANGILNTYGASNHQKLEQSENMGHAGCAKPRTNQSSFVGQNNSSATDQHISMIEETVLPPGTLPEASKNPILAPNMGISSNLDQKRKASEPILSPNVTKRRKALKLDPVMTDLGTAGRKVDPEDMGRQLRNEFFAHRKSLTAQSNNDGKDATDILGGSKSASTNSPPVVKPFSSENPTVSVTRENPNSPDGTGGDFSPEKTLAALNSEPVVLATQDATIETRTDDLDRNDPKESDVGSAHQAEIAPNVIPSAEVSATACPPKTQHSVFDRFIMTYPDYPGNSVQFAAICSRICTLFQEDRMEHPSLWDDFIVRHRTEYPQYMSQCADEAADPMPFERYYRSKIFQAKYVSPKGPVVTPINILEFQPHKPKHSTSTTRESSISKVPPTSISNREQRESKSIEVIELSDQEDFFKPVEKAKLMGSSKPKQVRRSLPWKNSDQVANGQSPCIKHTVSTPIAFVAQQQSSAKTSVFKDARQKAAPVSPPARKPSARGGNTSNPSSQSRPRNGVTSTSALDNLHPTPQNSNSNARPVRRSKEVNLANDPHSPYNTWARDYQAITPGKGNSYAQENASRPKPKEKRKVGPFDPFMFEL